MQFLSSYESSVDIKKRVSIPASFRKSLGGEDSVFLWPSLDKPCLEGGGMALVRKFQRAISKLKPLDPRRNALETAIFGQGRFAKFDEGGRIVLEVDLISHAGIEDKARFVGLGERFQIWAPATHDPRLAELRKLALDSADLLDAVEDDAPAPPTEPPKRFPRQAFDE
ncbi:MAG TPA: division/cell wall cluster transcriptional repressor MraZ [Hyphomonadaceae bacterium]|nr:division/cell wall cluster transcriptional repressor MraZ [Hyphomonadaceae bacterium]